MTIERILEALPTMSAGERERVRDNAQRLLAAGSDAQKADARRTLDTLSELAEAEHRAMLDRLGGLETAARVTEAFRAVPMTETEQKLVQVLLDHPGSTSTQLSAALGWGGKAWHLHFGEMCKKRAVYLWPAPRAEERDADFYSGILADFENEGSRFTLNPTAVAAFEAMGIKATRP